MNELVQRLSNGRHPVVLNRPDKSGTALKERIELGYVHVLFEDTGTEIGIYLDKENCNLTKCNFERSTGDFHLEGVITLNYDKVRCLVEGTLESMSGKAYLQPIDDHLYKDILGRHPHI